MGNAEKYLKFYKKKPGNKITKKELELIESRLKGCKKILSVGCGPAVLEAEFNRLHKDMEITGLDISGEMLEQAPKSFHTVQGDAQNLNFDGQTFDAVLYLTSLEFIPDYKKAIKEAYRTLKGKGKILVMMLNPESDYFREKYANENSYIRGNIKHMDIHAIKDFMLHYFYIKSEGYFLGIKDGKVMESNDPKTASLYILEGIKNGERRK